MYISLFSRRDTVFYISLLERIFCMARIRKQKYSSFCTVYEQILILVISVFIAENQKFGSMLCLYLRVTKCI